MPAQPYEARWVPVRRMVKSVHKRKLYTKKQVRAHSRGKIYKEYKEKKEKRIKKKKWELNSSVWMPSIGHVKYN